MIVYRKTLNKTGCSLTNCLVTQGCLKWPLLEHHTSMWSCLQERSCTTESQTASRYSLEGKCGWLTQGLIFVLQKMLVNRHSFTGFYRQCIHYRGCLVSNKWCDELKRIRQEADVVYFKVLFQYLPGKPVKISCVLTNTQSMFGTVPTSSVSR
jgi:hypothetical protein